MDLTEATRSGRPSVFMLAFTIVGLAAAGVFALLDLDNAADVALILAGLVPLFPLVREMMEKLRQRQPGVDIIALLAVAASLALGELLTAAVIGLMLATK